MYSNINESEKHNIKLKKKSQVESCKSNHSHSVNESKPDQLQKQFLKYIRELRMQRSINVSSPSPKKKKAKSSFHSYQNGRETRNPPYQELRKNQQNFNQANGHMWTAIRIQIPRRLSHRVGLYHQATLPCGSSPNIGKDTPKAWDGAGHLRKICPDTYGTFPKDRAGVRAQKNEKNFRHCKPLPRALQQPPKS